MPRLAPILIVLFLTAISFVGGLAWALAQCTRRGWRTVWFFGIYACLTAMLWLGSTALHRAGLAPEFLRLPVTSGPSHHLASQSRIFAALNRGYVSPEMRGLAHDLADHMAREFPGTVTMSLDGNLPFGNGIPLLPHLSHDDGTKLDFALYWQDETGTYSPAGKSPIGYWGYAQGQSDCPDRWADLRWGFAWMQPMLPKVKLDKPRTHAALKWLANDPRVAKILVEPHITRALNLTHPKIRFQGCRAARHDDHIHIQL